MIALKSSMMHQFSLPVVNGKINSYNSKSLMIESIHWSPSSCTVIRNSNAVGKYLSWFLSYHMVKHL